jgi:hypothetical protein
MKVLVACEYSGRVRDAFTALGHDATSCDLLPSDTSGNHYRGDVRNIILDGWDLMIAHPPCTDLASSGAQYWPAKRADGRQQAALDFFMMLYESPIPRVAIENPVGFVGTAFRKANQIIQPWQFGEPYNKKTCLWLRGLPPLTPTNIIEPTHNWSTGSYQSGSRKRSNLPIMHGDWKNRSRTFQGIADAMAMQWGVDQTLADYLSHKEARDE